MSAMQRCPSRSCGARAYHYDRAIEAFRCDQCGHTDRSPRGWSVRRASAFEPEGVGAAADAADE